MTCAEAASFRLSLSLCGLRPSLSGFLITLGEPYWWCQCSLCVCLTSVTHLATATRRPVKTPGRAGCAKEASQVAIVCHGRIAQRAYGVLVEDPSVPVALPLLCESDSNFVSGI